MDFLVKKRGGIEVLRKLYEELVAIKNELQAIRNDLKYERSIRTLPSNIGAIKEIRKRYINQAEDQVIVSFELPVHDWCLLKRSTEWSLVEKRLMEIQSRHSCHSAN